MSHSKKDAVGGHMTNWLVTDGIASHRMNGRRWAKKFNRREARREAKKVTAEAILEHEEDIRRAQEELYWHEANSDFYDMIYEDELEMEHLDRVEFEQYDEYYDYYDPFAYDDPFWHETDHWDEGFRDWSGAPAPEPEPVTVAYHQLNEPVYATGQSLGEILERMLTKKG